MPSVKAYLLLISSFLLGAIQAASQNINNVNQKVYNVNIKVGMQKITGLVMMEFQTDRSIVGAIVNEFGIKVYDFYYSDGKTRIMNVIAPLNKWYVRKVLRKDLSFILASFTHDAEILDPTKMNKVKRFIEMSNDGTLTLTNNRHKIVYTLYENSRVPK